MQDWNLFEQKQVEEEKDWLYAHVHRYLHTGIPKTGIG